MKYVFILLCCCAAQAWSFDPMAPPGYQQLDIKKKPVKAKKYSKPGYILRQIVIRDDNKSAVINGYVVNEGGYIKGALVKTIDANKVILEVSEKQKILYLKPNVARVRR